MEQMARNATGESRGNLERRRYALHDRDTKFCDSLRATLRSGGIRPIQLPARSPNLNAFAERWVRSAKQECLSKLILFGEASLRRALNKFIERYHAERNHQGQRSAVPHAEADLLTFNRGTPRSLDNDGPVRITFFATQWYWRVRSRVRSQQGENSDQKDDWRI